MVLAFFPVLIGRRVTRERGARKEDPFGGGSSERVARPDFQEQPRGRFFVSGNGSREGGKRNKLAVGKVQNRL